LIWGSATLSEVSTKSVSSCAVCLARLSNIYHSRFTVDAQSLPRIPGRSYVHESIDRANVH
jgi:hypothetical protein